MGRMLVQMNDEEYLVCFAQGFHPPHTTCVITRMVKGLPPSPKLSVMGAAFCSDKDVYDRVEGYKHALEDALRGFERTERTEFWSEFTRRYIPKAPFTFNMKVKDIESRIAKNHGLPMSEV